MKIRIRKSILLLAALLSLLIMGLGLLSSSILGSNTVARADDNGDTQLSITEQCDLATEQDCLPAFQPAKLSHLPQLKTSEEKSMHRRVLKVLSKVHTFPQNSHPVITSLEKDEKWAVVEAVWVYTDSIIPVPAESVRVIATNKAGKWRMALQGTKRFSRWLNDLPNTLVSDDEKSSLRTFLPAQ